MRYNIKISEKKKLLIKKETEKKNNGKKITEETYIEIYKIIQYEYR